MTLNLILVILVVVLYWAAYRIGYNRGAKRVLNEWKGWLNDSDQ